MQFNDPVGAHQKAAIPVMDKRFEDTTLQSEDFASMIFMNCDFVNLTIDSCSLHQTVFMNCRFDRCTIVGTAVLQTSWVQCQCTEVTILGGYVNEMIISDCEWGHLKIEQTGDQLVMAQTKMEQLTLTGAGANQTRLTISDCEIHQAEAENAEWKYATAVALDFANWSVGGSRFERCSFIKSKGHDVDFSSVHFDTCNLYQGEFPRAKFRSAESAIFAEAQLQEADCEGANLPKCTFIKVNAAAARFDGANLAGAMFPEAVLTGASLSRINAPDSVWIEADLTEANLDSANLYRGSFRGAIFDKANVSSADMRDTDLHGVKSPLLDANTSGARGTLEWRAAIEEEASKTPAKAASPPPSD